MDITPDGLIAVFRNQTLDEVILELSAMEDHIQQDIDKLRNKNRDPDMMSMVVLGGKAREQHDILNARKTQVSAAIAHVRSLKK